MSRSLRLVAVTSAALFACSGADSSSDSTEPAHGAASPLVAPPLATTHMSGDSIRPAPAVAERARAFLPHSSSAVAAGRTPASGATTAELSTASSAQFGVPACTSANVAVNHGQASMTGAKISLVYWGSWTTHPYDSYWQTLANTPAFYNRLREYGVTAGSYNQRYDYAAGTVGVALTEEQIKSGIQAAIGTYRASASDIFIVLLPSGTSSKGDNQYGYGGHHSSFSANGATVPWAVIEYSSNTTTTEWRSSHEVMEALTDPNATSSCSSTSCTLSVGTGWYPEIGDGCNGATTQIAGLNSQQFWSNSACRCVREEDLDNVDVRANGQFDYTVFRPSNAGWYGLGFSPNWAFGSASMTPFTGDFNGDGRTEFALFDPTGTPTTYQLDTVKGVYTWSRFGAAGDVPVPGDYDNPPDGKTDMALWQPSLGWRFVSSRTGATSAPVSWGIAGDIPVAADYDNDGITDFAVVRPSNGTWYVLPSTTPGSYTWASWTITTGDIPVTGDFNGDGVADWAFWRPSTGTWWIWYKNTVTAFTRQWGVAGDVPVPHDVDGDWLTDMQVWRPSNGTWYTIYSSTGAQITQQWGTLGDVPLKQ